MVDGLPTGCRNPDALLERAGTVELRSVPLREPPGRAIHFFCSAQLQPNMLLLLHSAKEETPAEMWKSPLTPATGYFFFAALLREFPSRCYCFFLFSLLSTPFPQEHLIKGSSVPCQRKKIFIQNSFKKEIYWEGEWSLCQGEKGQSATDKAEGLI